MNDSASLAYDIVLLPDGETAAKTIAQSKKIQVGNDALFELGEDVCVPHNSLYMTQLTQVGLQKALEVLENIAQNTPTLVATATNYFQAFGYIDVEYERTSQLAALQMAVIDAVNPLRDGMRKKDQEHLEAATGKVLENLKAYGYQGAGELFRPHITFTRFNTQQAIKTNDFPPLSDFNGSFVKIGIFEMGDNGTCARKVAIFSLQGGDAMAKNARF